MREQSHVVAATTESIGDQAARRSAAVKDLHQRYQHRQASIKEQRVARFALWRGAGVRPRLPS